MPQPRATPRHWINVLGGMPDDSTMVHRHQLANGLLSGAWTLVKTMFPDDQRAFLRWNGDLLFPFVVLEQASRAMFFKAWLQEAVAASLTMLREVCEELGDVFVFLGGETGTFSNPLAPPIQIQKSEMNIRVNCASDVDQFVASVIYNRIIGILAFEQRLASSYHRLHKIHGWNLLDVEDLGRTWVILSNLHLLWEERPYRAEASLGLVESNIFTPNPPEILEEDFENTDNLSYYCHDHIQTMCRRAKELVDKGTLEASSLDRVLALSPLAR